MRYIIYGAGAIGGVVGARLFAAGHEVVLICRGAHLDTIRRDGLRLRTPSEDVVLRVPAVGHPSEITFRDDDAVILTMKTQDTEDALIALERAAGTDVHVICCQNGVENERLALRRFAHVYGMLVAMPATFTEPGQINNEAEPIAGVLDAGCYPGGVDDFITRVAADISGSQMLCRAMPNVMRLKYGKLFVNLGNAVQVITGDLHYGPVFREVTALLIREAEACYQAARIDYATVEEYNAVSRGLFKTAPVAGQPRSGSSSWQSVIRGHTVLETDYLNGEIVLLGRLHGVPAPLNAMVQRLANRVAAGLDQPGTYPIEQLRAMAETMAAV